MMYLSKGTTAPSVDDGFDRVSHCGHIYVLGTEMSRLWRRGRYAPIPVPTGKERLVRRMADSGLANVTEETGALGAYRLLTGCILCPEEQRFAVRFLPAKPRRLWTWLRKAGLRLTASELIRLEERDVQPVPDLLGENGRLRLTEMIYTADTIRDGFLDTMMEHSPARDDTVSALLKLLRSRLLLLV